MCTVLLQQNTSPNFVCVGMGVGSKWGVSYLYTALLILLVWVSKIPSKPPTDLNVHIKTIYQTFVTDRWMDEEKTHSPTGFAGTRLQYGNEGKSALVRDG